MSLTPWVPNHVRKCVWRKGQVLKQGPLLTWYKASCVFTSKNQEPQASPHESLCFLCSTMPVGSSISCCNMGIMLISSFLLFSSVSLSLSSLFTSLCSPSPFSFFCVKALPQESYSLSSNTDSLTCYSHGLRLLSGVTVLPFFISKAWIIRAPILFDCGEDYKR